MILLSVDSGDILQLTMNVFSEQGETLVKMYHVFDKFAVGVPSRRYVLKTSLNHCRDKTICVLNIQKDNVQNERGFSKKH